MTGGWLPRMRGPGATIGIVGLGTIVAGIIADLDVHLASGVDAHGPAAHAAHAIVLLGMVLVLVAVLVDGNIGRHRRPDLHH
jgi:hypothetical protein